jgi:molybdopterin-guanine dinucleotide biosynthesis protein A
VIPRDGEERLEPTLALYEPQAGSLVDAMIDRGRRALRRLGDHPKTDTPEIPQGLLPAWTNVNTPQEFESFNTSRETDP